MQWSLEVIPVCVDDVDDAKRFYEEQVGFHLDLDIEIGATGRVVQLTPRGSASSIHLKRGATRVDGLQLVVDDVDAARSELIARGVNVSAVQRVEDGAWKLTQEATHPEQRRRQRYVDDEDIHAPSVITLNAVAAACAVDDWLMTVGGLVDRNISPDHWVMYHPLTDDVVEIDPVTEDGCLQCGPNRFALGDATPLPVAVTA